MKEEGDEMDERTIVYDQMNKGHGAFDTAKWRRVVSKVKYKKYQK